MPRRRRRYAVTLTAFFAMLPALRAMMMLIRYITFTPYAVVAMMMPPPRVIFRFCCCYVLPHAASVYADTAPRQIYAAITRIAP